MCGIVGFTGTEDKGILNRMNDAIIHRGPDDFGYYTDSKVSLGMRRLSIIDLETGKQPIHNEDGTAHIVFNGEIYNYKELKNELQVAGCKFYTNSDTETIVNAYSKYGYEFLKKLNGFFAFALWDSKRQILMLARDRMGKKPIYYTQVDGKLIFGSEIKSLLQFPGVSKEIDYQSLHDYLTFRYVPEPNTIFKHIKKVPAAHYLIWKDGKLEIKEYWAWEFYPIKMSESQAVDKFYNLLKESVRMRTMSEVPLGVFLSGGIDSAAVAGLLSQMSDNVKTFTMGYDVEGFTDELTPARKTADYFNTDHHEFVIKEDPLELLPEAIYHLDEPLADPACLSNLKLAQKAKPYVTVALVGEGSDEVLGGYEQYKIMKTASAIPKPLRNFADFTIKTIPKTVLDKLFRYTSEFGEKGQERFSDFLRNYKETPEDYLKIMGIFTEQEKNSLYTSPKRFEPSVRIIKPYFKYPQLLDNTLNTDQHTFLTHLLQRVDKMSMAYSIEARVPFLDKDLVEFSRRISPDLKVKGTTGKYILRKAMSKGFPKEIYTRKKQRFFLPITTWLKKYSLDIEKIFQESTLFKTGYFDRYHLKKILEGYDKSKMYYGRQLWSLLNLEVWHRIFIDNDKLTKKDLSLKKLYNL